VINDPFSGLVRIGLARSVGRYQATAAAETQNPPNVMEHVGTPNGSSRVKVTNMVFLVFLRSHQAKVVQDVLDAERIARDLRGLPVFQVLHIQEKIFQRLFHDYGPPLPFEFSARWRVDECDRWTLI
jgi:hypothetical protein